MNGVFNFSIFMQHCSFVIVIAIIIQRPDNDLLVALYEPPNPVTLRIRLSIFI